MIHDVHDIIETKFAIKYLGSLLPEQKNTEVIDQVYNVPKQPASDVVTAQLQYKVRPTK